MVFCCCLAPPPHSSFHVQERCRCAMRFVRWLGAVYNHLLLCLILALISSYFTVDAEEDGVCPIATFHAFMLGYKERAVATVEGAVSANIGVATGVSYTIPPTALLAVGGSFLLLGVLMLLGGFQVQRIVTGVIIVGGLVLAAENLVATELLRVAGRRQLSEVITSAPLEAAAAPLVEEPVAAATSPVPGSHLEASLELLSDGLPITPPLRVDLKCTGAFFAVFLALSIALHLLTARWFQRISLTVEGAACALLAVRLAADFFPPLLEVHQPSSSPPPALSFSTSSCCSAVF